MQESPRKANRTVLVRTVILMIVFGFVIFVPVVMQLYKIQIVDHEWLEQRAVDQQTRSLPISPSRGTIYDRNMKALAISATVETVFLEPKSIQSEADAKLIATELSRICGVDYDKLFGLTEKRSTMYQVVRRRIEKEMADEIRAFILQYGTKENKFSSVVRLEADSKRYYPYASFASNIIGFVGDDNQGLQGIEVKYEDDLKGTPGQVVTAKDNTGASMPFQYEKFFDAQDGQNLVLTLDETIQHFVEKHLDNAVAEYDVRNRASAIVMDVNSAEILAMATKGDYDLNAPFSVTDPLVIDQLDALEGEERTDLLRASQLSMWRNKPVVDSYEPGSTFKIITTAIGLEENVVTETDRFNCNGSIMVPGWSLPINCHKRTGHGSQSFVEGVMNSCNPVFITVGQRIGGQRFYEYMKAFGFMEKTGVDLPGESYGVIQTLSEFTKNQLTVSIVAFGQTFTITPIQLITAVSAVANGGNLMRPHLVREMLDKDGNVTQSFPPEVVRQVISAETSARVGAMLEQVVSNGTGRNAQVAGYKIAGKTGTGQKRDATTGEYLSGVYVTSFMAYAPADDPQIALLVLLDEPMAGAPNLRTGGGMAAPLAGRMLADILPYLGFVPEYTAGELSGPDVVTPSLRDLSVEEAKKSAEDARLKTRVVGKGETVTDQIPAAGAWIPSASEVVLYTEGAKPDEQKTVPDVRGKTPEQANMALVNAGFIMKAAGATGVRSPGIIASSQDYDPGASAPAGTVVTVGFYDDSIRD